MVSKAATSRFLMQATLGYDQALLDKVHSEGPLNWLKAELERPVKSGRSYAATTRDIWQDFKKRLVARHGARALNGEGNNPALPYKWYFHMAWWQHTLSHKDDLLRQRVAQALSEILVISDNSVLELDAVGMGSFYDILYQNAFGSYADMLYAVSMHPTMGIYLSHMNNRKADPANNIHPDENFAREIMQLFSIGLHQLNIDGSEKTGSDGNPLPTYDNQDIRELARVFTGLKAHSYRYEWQTSFWDPSFDGYEVGFDDNVEKAYKTVPFVEMTKPMNFDESYHDREPKSLLGGHIRLPGGQRGEDEVRSVARALVSHPSTAPFVARHMIARLVTSNPSKAYVSAVARAFGPNGDMKRMIETLLTYPLTNDVSEAGLKGAYQSDGRTVQSQKLKSPLLRMTQLLLAFNASNQSGKMWVTGDDMQDQVAQHPLSAPTVFNFYKATYTPHGELERRGLVAPEFEIHTSATSIAYVNFMYYWLFAERLPAVSTVIGQSEEGKMVPELDPEYLYTQSQDQLALNLSEEIAAAANPDRLEALVDRLGVLLTGRENLKIKPAVLRAYLDYVDQPKWVVQTILFMIAISPEFSVQEA